MATARAPGEFSAFSIVHQLLLQKIQGSKDRPFNVLLVLVPSLREEVLQDINWHKKGMKNLLLLTPKQPHLSFQQTPHLLTLLSGQICFPFIPVNPIPKQAYNIIPDADLANPSNAIYEEIMTWMKNLFSLPSGQQGKKVVQLLSEWLPLQQEHLLSRECRIPQPKAKVEIMLIYYPKDWSSGKQVILLIFSGKERLFKASSPQQNIDPLKTSSRSFQK